MLHEIYVIDREQDTRGADLLREIHTTLGLTQVQQVRALKVYRLEGLKPGESSDLAGAFLSERLTQTWVYGAGWRCDPQARCVKVAYKPGVMNPEAASIVKAVHDRGLRHLVAADSCWEYQFVGLLAADELQLIVDKLLVNKTVEQVVVEKPQTLLITGEAGPTGIEPITTLCDEELIQLSARRELHLNLAEMKAIQRHFQEVGREPTDAELETIAQTWSEHCGHKTMQGMLVVDGVEKEPMMTRIKRTAAKHFGDQVLSAFVDNSGVIAFYDGYAVCGKVETHNSPSAIEPYGGAMTGSGGVFRDIMGTGQGAKVILSTDMFCFAPPDLPAADLPPGCLHPRYLYRRVVAGVRDYGNRMGIPTSNGSVHFHPGFRAKPTVIVGAYGILPADKCQKGEPRPGDVVMVVGGRTGRDGIHGATFSSGEMTAQTISVNASAVQIGHAIEEKRMADALLCCRDEDVIVAETDCGAGGFSSAIGEMGAKTGVHVELEKAPLKYPGLAHSEVWVSESQERMVIAVAPKNVPRVQTICDAHNVEATVLGVFTDDQRLTVTYNGESVCDLSMEFLHHGLPKRVLVARKRERVSAELEPVVSEPQTPEEWVQVYEQVMAHWNVCSKEPIVRQYDHTVQGTSVLLPFSGVEQDGPNDAVVIRPLLGKPYGLVVAHGLNPVLNQIDPYAGSLWAVVEALSNYVAVGGDFRQAALIDNFIWPYPDEESLWDLDRSVDVCCANMDAFGRSFVSGKDSLSSTYRNGDFVLKIPPVLCVSVFGRIPDVAKTVTADFKETGSTILLVGTPDTENLGGSAYYDVAGQLGDCVPRVDLDRLPRTFEWLHHHIVAGNILACHDISEGGLAAALAEMCFGGGCGVSVAPPSDWQGRLDHWFFNETAGCFLIEVTPMTSREILASAGAANVACVEIGITMSASEIALLTDREVFSVPLPQLKEAWQQPMKEVFHG